MLILDRRKDGSVVVDGPAEIIVVAVKGNRVSLGFRAPDSTQILRTELIETEATERNRGDTIERRDQRPPAA